MNALSISPSMTILAMMALLLALLLPMAALASEHALKVEVYEGPSKNGGSCPSSEDTITAGDYTMLHFTASIDPSSKVGVRGTQVESTRTDGIPTGVTLGYGKAIPGWDEGLVGLCKGDKVILVVPPHLAYGDEGTGRGPNDVPGGATVRYDIEIVSVMSGPTQEEDEEEAKAMFFHADTNKDGKLTRAEFDEMFAQQIGEVPGAQEMSAIHSQLDKFWDSQDLDQDGFLSLEEFLVPSTFDTDREHRGSQDEFNDLDTDNDGKLSQQEINEFFSSLGQQVPDDFWEHLDENKDGFIDYHEFWVEDDDYNQAQDDADEL